jgi:hypothetical protein
MTYGKERKFYYTIIDQINRLTHLLVDGRASIDKTQASSVGHHLGDAGITK